MEVLALHSAKWLLLVMWQLFILAARHVGLKSGEPEARHPALSCIEQCCDGHCAKTCFHAAMSVSVCRFFTALPQQAQVVGRSTHARPMWPPATRALTVSGASARRPPRWRLRCSGWTRRRRTCCMSGGAGLARGVLLNACAVCGRLLVQPVSCRLLGKSNTSRYPHMLRAFACRLVQRRRLHCALRRAACGRPRRAPPPRRARRPRAWRRGCARMQKRRTRRWRRRKWSPVRRARSARSPRAPAARREHGVAPPERHPESSQDLLSSSRRMP
jgi:hypothetical protein